MKRRATRPTKTSWRQRWMVEAREPAEPDGVVRARAGSRMLLVGAFLGLGYLALVGRASALMLLPDPQLEAKAQVQFEHAVEVQGRRGDIVDRNGALLATTVELAEVHADPTALQPGQAEVLAAALAGPLGVPVQELLDQLARGARRDVRRARGLTPDQVAGLRGLAGRDVLWTEIEPRRYYPGRNDGVHVLGIVGHNGHGTAGLEQTLDSWLRGETYKYVRWRDRKGRQITPKVPPVQPGNTVALTLDRAMQRLVEDALDAGWERMQPAAIHAVVMDIKTGEILALANRPTLNPNDTANLDMSVLKNHAAMDAFEPGSVFKPFIAAAALEEGIVTPESPVDCEGGAWTVANKTITDDHPHGVVSVAEVIKYSSNIGAAKLAFKLGATRTVDYLTAFGFGRSTGLSLPGETRGFIRPAHSIKPIELATTSYGHGVTANTLQLAAAVATLGNGGVRMTPLLVREIRDRHGEIVRANDPTVDRRVVSEAVASSTVDMMIHVTEQGGTGTRARVEGYLVAGKTGTAWKHVDGGYSRTDRIGSFVGMIPADNPMLSISVVVDTPSVGSRYGGLTAGPIFSEIGVGAMRLMGVPPNPELEGEPDAIADADDEPTPPPIADVELTWASESELRTPDLAGLSLRDALGALQGAGLDISVRGSGRVASQTPSPGALVSPGDRVEVILQ